MRWTRRVVVAASALMAIGALGACSAPPGLDPEQLAACRTERDTVETALEVARVLHGAYPPSLEAMEGNLLEPGSLKFAWNYSTDGYAYDLTGGC